MLIKEAFLGGLAAKALAGMNPLDRMVAKGVFGLAGGVGKAGLGAAKIMKYPAGFLGKQLWNHPLRTLGGTAFVGLPVAQATREMLQKLDYVPTGNIGYF